jgi:transposase
MKRVMGIDVGKYELVIYAWGKYFSIANETPVINDFLKQYQMDMKEIDLVVFEATGGYESSIRNCMLARKYSYHMAHANKVRAYAKAKGYLAKTDKLDAKIIAEYGQLAGVEADVEQEKNHQRLKALLDRREQLIQEKTREKNRCDKELDTCAIESIERHVSWLNEEIKCLEEQIKNYIDQDPETKKQIDLYSSIPGIGKQTAAMMLVYLPELGKGTDKQVVALSGLAPMNCDSGQFRGKRRILAGRIKVRKALYMATLTAIRFNKVIKVFYERLYAKGKAFKVAMTAAMRKLLLILNSVSKRQTKWIEQIQKT